jgi:curli biogenesis system outer membrane secretion channel CsgG
MKLSKTLLLLFVTTMFGCSSYLNQPMGVEVAEIGTATPATGYLKNLPLPKEQVVVGVYKFRDQTGQYKSSETGSTFSTAVTQGATSILIKALEDSKWFIPIERENLGNLLNERNIIRSTRQEYLKAANPKEPQLTPLLYAGVLLEGGIVSYDSNIMTGGFGARYFGAGGSVKYRQDRVTIYLRLVSTSNGEILKTIYVSKTILSQAIDASLFRYVDLKRLLEVETGFTKNEPIQLAVTEAIEKAVHSLVVEGIVDDIWKSTTPVSELTELIGNYDADKTDSGLSMDFKKKGEGNRGKLAIEIAGGAALIDGDLENPISRPLIKAGLKYFLKPNFNINVSGNLFSLSNKDVFSDKYSSFDLNGELILLPKSQFSPYLYGGPGLGYNIKLKESHYKFQYGVGLEYLVSNQLGIRLFGEQNMTFTDNIDKKIYGKRDDFYWRFGAGMTFYIKKFKNNKNKKVVKT